MWSFANLYAEQSGHKAKCKAGQSAERKAYRHMIAGIHSIRQDAVEVAREAIYKADDSHYDTERGVRDTVLGCQTRHCEREVLTNEVEEGVAQHRHDDGAPLPNPKSFLSLCIHSLG